MGCISTCIGTPKPCLRLVRLAAGILILFLKTDELVFYIHLHLGLFRAHVFSVESCCRTPTLKNMKRHTCAHTHTLTSDAHLFVIYCLFRIPHTASSLWFPACCLPVHAFLLWPVAYSILLRACGLQTDMPSVPNSKVLPRHTR